MKHPPLPRPALSEYLRRLLHPAARTDLVTAVVALLVVFAIQYEHGVPIAAAIPIFLAAVSLGLRWTGMPGVFVIALVYFIVLPFGTPALPANETILGNRFRLDDMILVGAVLAFLATLYRLYGIAHQALPARLVGAEPPRRPAEQIQPGELPRLFGSIALAVLGGQGLWWIITAFVVDFESAVPLRRSSIWYAPTTPVMLSRFLIFAGGVALFAAMSRFVFWYWRLQQLRPAAGRLHLLDDGWRENRRELARQETWRAWGLGRRAAVVEKPRQRWFWTRVLFILLAFGYLAWAALGSLGYR